jgi:hypothetical protein
MRRIFRGNDIDTFKGVCYFFSKLMILKRMLQKQTLYRGGGKTVNAANVDEFGYDRGIRRMRRVFSQMEAVSTKLIVMREFPPSIPGSVDGGKPPGCSSSGAGPRRIGEICPWRMMKRESSTDLS